ncbi:MAG: hypothetical protein AB8B61_01340 [Cyclobacteriaceae bacterium]
MSLTTEKYAMLILKKVSFDNHLFKKEFSKTLLWLNEPERKKVKDWVKTNYPMQFSYANSFSPIGY